MDPTPTNTSSNTGTMIFIGLGALAFFWAMFRYANPNKSQREPKVQTRPSLQCIEEMKQMRNVLEKGEITEHECRKSLWLVFTYTMEKVN